DSDFAPQNLVTDSSAELGQEHDIVPECESQNGKAMGRKPSVEALDLGALARAVDSRETHQDGIGHFVCMLRIEIETLLLRSRRTRGTAVGKSKHGTHGYACAGNSSNPQQLPSNTPLLCRRDCSASWLLCGTGLQFSNR